LPFLQERRLETVFERYAPQGQEIALEAWCQRGRWHKLKDHAVYLLNEIL